MSAPNVDIGRLHEINSSLSQLKNDSKLLKSEENAIKNQAIEAMINMRLRYISETPSGDGPYWCLNKSVSEGSFNSERQLEFFTIFLTKCNDSSFTASLTPESCIAMVSEYLSKFQKRKLVLKRQNALKSGETIDSLLHWLEHGA